VTGEPLRNGTGDGLAPVVQLVPVYLGSQASLLPHVAARLERTFGVAVESHPPGFDPEVAYDDTRGQYDSRVLLSHLVRELRPGCARVIGIIGTDLFIPVLTFVFGEAQLAGQAAIVSTHRLGNEPMGLVTRPGQLLDRLVKEAVHELGHTYGLVHCRDGRCVMASSTYVEEIDLKGADFCLDCLRRLRAQGGARALVVP
jgi:archaemetzincin